MPRTQWPELMRVKEVAEILDVSPMTVYRLVHTGALEHKKVVRGIRVYAASLETYLGLTPETETSA